MFISMVIHSFAVHIISNPQMVKISSTNPFHANARKPEASFLDMEENKLPGHVVTRD